MRSRWRCATSLIQRRKAGDKLKHVVEGGCSEKGRQQRELRDALALVESLRPQFEKESEDSEVAAMK